MQRQQIFVFHVWQSYPVTHTTRVTPAMVRNTGLSRSCNCMEFGNIFVLRQAPSKPRARNIARKSYSVAHTTRATPSHTPQRATPALVRNTNRKLKATTTNTCVSRVTELLRHTHHRSYSCNGAKHIIYVYQLKQQPHATATKICVSRLTELPRHTHHKSYSCNGAKHRTKT